MEVGTKTSRSGYGARSAGIFVAAAAVVVVGFAWFVDARRAPVSEGSCTEADVARAVASVSTERIADDLDQLTRVVPINDQGAVSRHVDAPGNTATVAWLLDAFEGMGVEATTMRFSSDGRRLANVVATVAGSEPGRSVGVGAHLDSTSDSGEAPGADDNASGLVAALEAARAVARLPTGCLGASVHFAAFNDEEEGMVGSAVYADRESATMEAFINLDMIGTGLTGSVPTSCLVASHRGANDEAVARQFVEAAGSVGEDLQIHREKYDEPDQDGASFWAAGIPVTYVHECQFSPHYHSSTDLAHFLDLAQITAATKATVATVLNLATRPD